MLIIATINNGNTERSADQLRGLTMEKRTNRECGCELAEAICESKTSICEIADLYASSGDFSSDCEWATQECEWASEQCSVCEGRVE